MIETLQLNDAALSAAAANLLEAAEAAGAHRRKRELGTFDSLTGIDQSVQEFFLAVAVACAALADAARSASGEVLRVIQHSDAVDKAAAAATSQSGVMNRDR